MGGGFGRKALFLDTQYSFISPTVTQTRRLLVSRVVQSPCFRTTVQQTRYAPLGLRAVHSVISCHSYSNSSSLGFASGSSAAISCGASVGTLYFHTPNVQLFFPQLRKLVVFWVRGRFLPRDFAQQFRKLDMHPWVGEPFLCDFVQQFCKRDVHPWAGKGWGGGASAS